MSMIVGMSNVIPTKGEYCDLVSKVDSSTQNKASKPAKLTTDQVARMSMIVGMSNVIPTKGEYCDLVSKID